MQTVHHHNTSGWNLNCNSSRHKLQVCQFDLKLASPQCAMRESAKQWSARCENDPIWRLLVICVQYVLPYSAPYPISRHLSIWLHLLQNSHEGSRSLLNWLQPDSGAHVSHLAPSLSHCFWGHLLIYASSQQLQANTIFYTEKSHLTCVVLSTISALFYLNFTLSILWHLDLPCLVCIC